MKMRRGGDRRSHIKQKTDYHKGKLLFVVLMETIETGGKLW